MPLLRSLGIKWGLATIYVLLCLSLILLLPSWFRPVAAAAYLGYAAWVFWTLEHDYSRSEMVRPLTAWDVPDFPAFRERLRLAALDLGLRREPVYAVIDEEELNAWALGGRRGVVGFTTALLRQCPPDELLAIAGHELKHLASRDALPAIVGGSWLSLLGWTSAALDRNAPPESLYGFVFKMLSVIIDILAAVVGWFAHIVLAKRSRFNEQIADLAGARVTSAGVMIRALERLEAAADKPPGGEAPRWSPAWIVDQLHRSHPPTNERIAYLQGAVERGEINA